MLASCRSSGFVSQSLPRRSATCSRTRDLRRLQLAFLGSELGLWAATVALAVIAFGAGGAAGVAILAVVRQLPAAFAAPFTAILGDRYDRVRVMIGSDLLRAAATAVAAAAAFADAPVAVVFAAASFSSLAATAFRPAEAALLPALAHTPAELTAANVTSSTIESVMAFVGPAVGGVLVAVADPGVAFVVCVGTFVLVRLPRFADRSEDRCTRTRRLAGGA